MVRASFRALERRDAGKSARVLDPAVGGGMFLLTAFRELVAQHWRTDGRRPDTDVLRRILYEQMVGFDINEAALRFAALGLYLLSIELDPNPRPVDKLRFEDLRGTVLHRVKGVGEEEGTALGSLGPLVGEEHLASEIRPRDREPPWPSGTKLPEWNGVCETVARIAAARGIANAAPPLPNEVLDLPFVWRAMEWAKPDGQIAFALHARLLFQQGDGMPTARQALFEALDVTSVVNGVELRQTKVWPQISAPFCILFGTNRTPGVEAGFRFICPRIEGSLNSAGGYAHRRGKRGSRAFQAKIGVAHRRRLRGSGNGYQTLRRSSRVRRRGDGLPGVDASYLHGLPEITAESFTRIIVDTSSLDIFSHERIHDPRALDLFGGPQLIVHKSPPAVTGRIGVVVSDKGLVFNQTFYGYSPGAHPDAALLVRYLALVLGSKLVVWLALVTSGEFGFEREAIEKATLDHIPRPAFDELEAARRREIAPLVDGLQSGEVTWDEVDEWVNDLYGLGKRDLQVILDTLEFNLPFAENKGNAQAVPSSTERRRFCEVLRDELRPWCDRFGSSLAVGQIPPLPMSPWQAIAVRTVIDIKLSTSSG